MPCYGPDGPPNLRSDLAERELSRVRRQLDEATAAACELSQYVSLSSAISRSTREWVLEHQKLDKKRAKK